MGFVHRNFGGGVFSVPGCHGPVGGIVEAGMEEKDMIYLAFFVGLCVGFLIGWCGCAWLINKKVPASSNQGGENGDPS